MFGYLLLGWLGGINTWMLVILILDWREDLREAREREAEP